MRLKIFRITTYVLFVMIAGNLFFLQAVKGDFYHRLSTNNRIRVVPMEGWRGRIMDRNGIILADNRLAYHVLITPQSVNDINELFSFLEDVTGLSKNLLLRRYRERKTAPFIPVVVAEDVSRQAAVKIEEHKFRFPALEIRESYRRFYPLGPITAHLVGYTAKADQNRLSQAKKYGLTPQTMVGYSGVEEQYDGELKGGDGGLQIEVNSRGEQVRLLGWKDPTAGNDFIVTVDSRIQEAAMKALGEARGAVVMMDADTGEILTLASAPSYDPNAFKESDRRDEINSYFRDRRSPMLNRAIGGVYPPGSIFKVIVGVAGIDQSKINRTNRYRCNGFLELGGTRFGCTHVHGDENLEEALGHSCNVYFYHLGLVLGADVIHRYASIFGMGKLTRVDLPYEKKGGLPLRSQHLAAGKRWFTGDTLNISIGQGDVLATPIQMAALMATVLNNGDTVQPQVKYQDPRPERKGNFFPRSNIGLSAAVFAEIKKGLRFAVADPDGTAHVLSEIPGLSVAGKTGTAQAGHDRDHHAWFAGYVEKGFNRRIAFCVFLEHGGSSHNACLVARNILAEVKEKGLL